MMTKSAENIACSMLLCMLCVHNLEIIYLQLKTRGGTCHLKTILYSYSYKKLEKILCKCDRASYI